MESNVLVQIFHFLQENVSLNKHSWMSMETMDVQIREFIIVYWFASNKRIMKHFAIVLQVQSTPEQLEKWMPLIKKYKIVGTYAQTEMGHGKCAVYTTVLLQ